MGIKILHPMRLPPYDIDGNDLQWAGRPMKSSDKDLWPIIGSTSTVPDTGNFIGENNFGKANHPFRAPPKLINFSGEIPDFSLETEEDVYDAIEAEWGAILPDNGIVATRTGLTVTGLMPYYEDEADSLAVSNSFPSENEDIIILPRVLSGTLQWNNRIVDGSKLTGRDILQFDFLFVDANYTAHVVTSAIENADFDYGDSDVYFYSRFSVSYQDDPVTTGNPTTFLSLDTYETALTTRVVAHTESLQEQYGGDLWGNSKVVVIVILEQIDDVLAPVSNQPPEDVPIGQAALDAYFEAYQNSAVGVITGMYSSIGATVHTVVLDTGYTTEIADIVSAEITSFYNL